MADTNVVTYMSAASALFLSSLIIVAIARQKTHRAFQKHILLIAIYLLVCAIISNVLISIYVSAAQGSQEAIQQGIILSKRVQASFDYLFGITIGAFIFIATTPTIGSRKDFVAHMKKEFPNSYVFYLFLMALTIFTIWYSGPTVVSTNPTVIRFETYFLVINGIAVATLILYAPYRFIFYLRKTKPGQEVRRDTFFIIIGITGFALSELLFEILFPNYGIDLRAPGFIMEMALIGLIAFGVRGESFLQELIVPEAEAHLLTKPTYALGRGITYVVLERDATQAFEIFKDLVTHGAQGLCITRRSPKSVMTEYGLERTPVLWLSRVSTEKNTVRPSPPENVAMAIEHFIGASERPVVLLDGFEYLVSHNDFGSVLALLHDLNESVAIRESILLVPFDPSAFNEREIALIRREVRMIGPMAEEFGQVTKISP
ncbi:MAG TPA: DUF835 domain-containing protein [Thermoplasmata archaeon]|nr:DUF835 domain-containing protein [Thermoplasmata archaeon]